MKRLLECKDGRLYRLEEGHGRMLFGKTLEGEWAFTLGVSETCVDEPSVNCDSQDEDIYPVVGLVIHSPAMARAMAEGLNMLANKMEEER